MSQTPNATGEQTPRRSRYRWIWILLALMICPPMLLVVVLTAAYQVHNSRVPVQAEEMARAQALAEYQKRLAEDQRQQQAAQTQVQMAAQRVQGHVVRVQISFEDLETRYTNALIVEREGNVSQLTATKDAFASITSKVNGRAVTRQPSNIRVVGILPDPLVGGPSAGPAGMAMMPSSGPLPGSMPGAFFGGSGGGMGYASASEIQIGRELAELGLVVLKTPGRLSPLRVLGDFTKATVGEKLSVISVQPSPSNASEVAVLATDESVSIAPDKTLNHVLKLTAWNGEEGAIVCNGKGDAIGQIVATITTGKMTYSYAVPMDRLFGALYRDMESPESKMEDPLPGFPLTAEILPVDNSEPFRDPDDVPDVRPTGKVDSPPSTPPLTAVEKEGQSPPSAPAIDEAAELDDQVHRKEPRRTRSIKIPGRKLEDVAKILTSLFGAKADIAIDEAGGAVLITINRAKTWGEVEFLLAEIEATASRLAQPNQEEFAKLVDEFNELFRSGRFSEAGVIAKRAKELVPDSVQADMMLSKSRLAARVAAEPEAEGRTPTRSDLDALIPEGMHIVSVPVTAIMTDSDVLRPGDFVDIDAVIAVPQRGGEKRTQVQMLQRIQVFEVDSDKRMFRQVAFLVYPRQSRLIQLANKQSNGNLKLALHRSSDKKPVNVNDLTEESFEVLSGELSSGLAAPPALSDDSDKSLEAESRELALRLRTAAPKEAPALRKQLEELTQRHFEVRQQRRKQEIEELGTRVDKLRLGHLRREQNKSEVIQRRIKELLDPNTDLRWDDTSNGNNRSPVIVAPTSVSATRSIPEIAPDDLVPTATTVDATVPGSKATFDGVGYPQWLTLLETERKPEKLATAIEACSRLANVADAHRITQGILRAAHLFETGDSTIEGDSTEQELIWTAAADGLNRLAPEVVTDSLILALRNHDDDYRGGSFQAIYLTYGEISRKIEAKKIHELIGELLKVEPDNMVVANRHLSAACRVWQFTDRPIDDFAGLGPATVKLIDQGPNRDQSWQNVVDIVVDRYPQMPDLAVKLLPYADVDERLWPTIGKLKAHAEPAVPLIVERFVKRWQKGEDEALALARKRIERPLGYNPFGSVYIQTLGEIGTGPKGWQLLSELHAIRSRFSSQTLEIAIARFHGPREIDSKSLILSDYSMISGEWRLKEIAPGTAPADYLLSFNRSPWAVERLDTSPKLEFANGVIDFFSHTGAQSFELDTKASPKRITLISHGFGTSTPETRREGIYELTATGLRLQFAAGINQPPPKEFAAPASLPDEVVLLEFARESSDESELSAPRR